MPNQPNNPGQEPGQQIEQPPTRAEKKEDVKNASSDKKPEADKYKSPSEGG